MFETASFNLPGGKKFTVKAKNFSKENKYIKSATLNGKPLAEPFFNHSDLAEGGRARVGDESGQDRLGSEKMKMIKR